MILIYLLAAYGLAFSLKELAGPWGIFSKLRNYLFTSTKFGVFFYELFSCYFCLGFHTGWIVNLFSPEPFHFGALLIWGFASGIFCLIIDACYNKVSQVKEEE
jgi:hypothetical protein